MVAGAAPVINQFTRDLKNSDRVVNKIMRSELGDRSYPNCSEEFTSATDPTIRAADRAAATAAAEGGADPGGETPVADVDPNLNLLGFREHQIREVVEGLIREIEATAPGLLGNVGSFVGDLVLVFVMGIYWITSRSRAEEFLVDLLPISRQAQARGILDEIEVGLGGYVRGIMLVSVLVGLLSFAAMTVVNQLPLRVSIPNAATLSFFYGLATAIPIIGGLIGIVIATGLAFLTATPASGLAVVSAITFLLQQVENYYNRPRVMATVRHSLNPCYRIYAAGFTLDGLRGGLISIPVAATAAILMKHLLIFRVRIACFRRGRGRYHAHRAKRSNGKPLHWNKVNCLKYIARRNVGGGAKYSRSARSPDLHQSLSAWNFDQGRGSAAMAYFATSRSRRC